MSERNIADGADTNDGRVTVWALQDLRKSVDALVEQQRIANLIALGHLQIASGLDGIGDIVGDGSAFRALYPEGPNTPLATDIAHALEIGDSDE